MTLRKFHYSSSRTSQSWQKLIDESFTKDVTSQDLLINIKENRASSEDLASEIRWI